MRHANDSWWTGIDCRDAVLRAPVWEVLWKVGFVSELLQTPWLCSAKQLQQKQEYYSVT